jgi:CheY-like chemotaxis protein
MGRRAGDAAERAGTRLRGDVRRRPKRDGAGVVRRVRARKILEELKSDPTTKKIPVVIISSCDEDKAALELGAEKFLHKPINFDQLFAVLKEIKEKYAINRDA